MKKQLPNLKKVLAFVVIALLVVGIGYTVGTKSDALLYALTNTDKVRATIKADQALQEAASQILTNNLSQIMTEANYSKQK